MLCSLLKIVWQLLKILHRVIWPRSFISRYILKIIENMCPCKNLYIEYSSSINHNSTEMRRSKCSSADEWMNTIWYIHKWNIWPVKGIKYWHTLQYGSILKIFCYMKEASHKTPHIVWFNLYQMSRIGNSIETQNRLLDAGMGKWRVTASGWWKCSKIR